MKNRNIRPVVVVAIVVLLFAGIAAWLFSGDESFEGPVRIATGGEGGTYSRLGEGFAVILEREIPDVGVRVRPTAGSLENLELLSRGEVDVALLQDDTGNAGWVRTLAPLYDEVLHVVVRANLQIDGKAELEGKRIAVGAKGSGTEVVARAVLGHFGVDDGTATLSSIGGEEALAAFADGRVDAVCVLAGLPSDLVRRLLKVEGAEPFSLGGWDGDGSSMDGLTRALPTLRRAVIPAALYGRQPRRALGTVSVKAILAAHRDLDPEIAKRITRELFENKVELVQHHPAVARLNEGFDRDALRYPLHEGAEAYYAREEPSFFVEYAEPISLGFTLLVAAGSGFLALREWMRRRKKNRIDSYYVDLEKISDRIDVADRAELVTLRTEIHDLRVRAFKDLVEERLAADESFTIFQDFLSSRKARIDDRLAVTPEE